MPYLYQAQNLSKVLLLCWEKDDNSRIVESVPLQSLSALSDFRIDILGISTDYCIGSCNLHSNMGSAGSQQTSSVLGKARGGSHPVQCLAV